MMNVISSEIYKIFKSKILYGVCIVLLGMNALGFFSVIKYKLSSGSPLLIETGINAYKQSYGADGIIYLILIFVAFLITAEFANGTIGQMACRGIERWKLVLGQYIAISLVATIVVLGFGFVNLLFFTIFSGLGEVHIGEFMAMNLGLISLIWASTGFCTFLSYLFKNVGITIIASLLLVKGSDFIAQLFALVTKNDIFTMFGATNMREIIIDFASKPGDIIKCCFVLVLICVVGILATCLLFSKRDVD